MIPTILAYAVVAIAFPLNWYVVWRLWLLHHASPELQVLRERGIAATALAAIVTVFAIVFLNNGMEFPILDGPATQIITRLAILALSIPALYWLFLYRNGR